jgi:CRP-like cAMP-binding protein
VSWPLLADLPAEDVRELMQVARRRTFGRGEVVFHEGDPAESLHLIEKGRFTVRTRKSPPGMFIDARSVRSRRFKTRVSNLRLSSNGWCEPVSRQICGLPNEILGFGRTRPVLLSTPHLIIGSGWMIAGQRHQ